MFRVAARTVLQLGAELISSDAVAFYELIKNAFDAASPKVSIHVVIRLPQEFVRTASSAIKSGKVRPEGSAERANALGACKETVSSSIIADAPGAGDLRASIAAVQEWEDLQTVLDEANSIEIHDTGTGMSLSELEDIYLTIGTRSRLKEREQRASRPHVAGPRVILGEKGLGRLAAMRLGQKLRLVTSRANEESWHVLEIDWRRFSHESDKLLEDVDIRPAEGDSKPIVAESGTRIRISALTGTWDKTTLGVIAADEFSKLTDPFVPKAKYRISLTFNGAPVPIPDFDRLLLKYAHAVGSVQFILDGADGPRLTGRIDYRMRNREESFALEADHLLSTVKLEDTSTLLSLGPFTADFYWFNRKVLKELEENLEEVARVIELQERWAGGLMVFRDGFRVYPYGSPADDWLGLDKKALASGGYKVNRRQIVGRVVISSAANPALFDQSNREGLRDGDEKRALVRLLKYSLEGKARAFLNRVDRDARINEPTTFQDLEEQIEQSEERIASGLRTLIERHPEVGDDESVVAAFKDAIADLNRRLKDAKALAESFDTRHAQVIHLAGTGLMVEMLAHELNRATTNALVSLSDAGRKDLPPAMTSLVSTLQSELKTLQRRLKILDPLSTAGRHRKESFDLPEWLHEVLEAHSLQFKRHGIAWDVRTIPDRTGMRIKAVKGMIVQVLENLINNSVYWLKQRKKTDRGMKPKVDVVIDTARREVRFSDNGPGIPPARKEEVFQPFVTTKPPGEGKGLGLYIAREVARYNDAILTLADEVTSRSGHLNTFILSLGGGA